MNPLLRVLWAGAGVLARGVMATGLPGDGKLARSVAARRDLRRRYAAFAASGRRSGAPLVWFHAPSVGEGLQATPVMSRCRILRPDVQQAYTHFSPSAAAFAQRTGADFADYLPFDIASEMCAALDALQPAVLIFSKLDVWPGLVREAAARSVRLGMISATLAAGSGRRGALASALTRDAYAALDAVGAIDASDAERLVALGVRRSVITVTGDTRYDQVWARAQRVAESAPWLERFRAVRRPTLVAGSTWPADEAHLRPAVAELLRSTTAPRPRVIIAPHEPTPGHLADLEAWAATSKLTLARLDASNDTETDIVLVDRVGVLGDLYGVADVAYVGGGFHDAGLHSVLEPAAFGVPVVFGPRHANSRDAGLLLACGGACEVTSAPTLQTPLAAWLGGHPAAGVVTPSRDEAGAAAAALVRGGLGAADRATALVLALLDR